MKICWSTNKGDVQDGFLMRNPDFFSKPIAAEKTVLVGNYPHIVEAYKEAGIDIATGDKPKSPTNKKEPVQKPAIKPTNSNKNIEPDGKRDNSPKDVEIPDGWNDLPFMTQRSIAWDIAGNNEAKNGKDVNIVIQAEIERRKA